jgi:signal transduction histidine kinase
MEVVNILVVDDQEANLLAMETLLKGRDLNVVTARSGNEALAHLLETDFACLVLDVMMPEMDGFELAKIIRADERTKYVPILFASAQQAQTDVFKGYETGAVDYLLKPLEPTIVRSKIHVFAELYRKELARKRAEAAMNAYAEELKRSNAELDRYASVVAHDLQAPLRRVASCATTLAERHRDKLDGEAGEWLEMMVENANRMQSLIADLLRYAKAGRERTTEKLDLGKIVGEVLRDLSVPIEETGAKIRYENLPTVTFNALDLRQLLQNLIGNAVKYRKPEGDPEIRVTAEKRDADWLVSVHDDGIGIDPKDAEKLFALFSRLHDSAQYPGTGIGLAICRKIVERHGGKIWIESETGRGSTFRFTIPTP